MKKLLFIAIGILALNSLDANAQRTKNTQKITGAEITYKAGSKSDKPVFTVKTIGNKSVAQSIKILPGATNLQEFVDFETQTLYRSISNNNGEASTTEKKFDYTKLDSIGTEKIAGWNAIHVRTSIRSNSVDIYYTKDIGYKGSPQPQMAIMDGMILKIVRNGNVMLEAVEAKQITETEVLFPQNWGTIVDPVEFDHNVRNANVIKIDVFSNERVSFNGVKNPVALSETIVNNVAGGAIVMRKVKLPENVDNRSIFVELSEYSDGEAYDRVGSVFIVPTDKKQSFLDALTTKGVKSLPSFTNSTGTYQALVSTPDYNTPVEVMRFMTPFGVGAFNDIKVKGYEWADSVIFKAEVTHLAPMLKGEVWIGAYVSTWNAKGYKISMNLKYHPSSRTNKANTIYPLINTVSMLEQAGQGYPTVFGNDDKLEVKVNIDKPLKNARIVYTTTGHGGWGGGDEFNPKLNTIYMDGKEIFKFIPWREDCASYRHVNPCSGNFSNGLSSSDLSRSNWCPGTVTFPTYIPVGDISKGEHTISIKIDEGLPEGTSFSYWCISAVLIGE